MKTLMGFLAFSAFLSPPLLGTSLSHAESLDLTTLKCKTFLEGRKEDIASAVAWLDGYNKTEDDPELIDLDKLKENIDSLVAYCGKNPDSTVSDAAGEIFGK